MKIIVEQELTEETEISTALFFLFPPVRTKYYELGYGDRQPATDVLAAPRYLGENEPSSRKSSSPYF
jgi:hypothetical protein